MKPPDSYAETPEGLIILADGLGPVMRWDGQADRLLIVGVHPPAAPCVIGPGSGRPAAPATAPTVAVNPGAVGPPPPAAPTTAPSIFRDQSRDYYFFTRSVTLSWTRSPGLAGGYQCACRYIDVDGVKSAWGPLSDVFVANRTNPDPYPPSNVFTLRYTNVPVPTDPRIKMRQIALNGKLLGQFDPFHNQSASDGVFILDVITENLTLKTFLSNHGIVAVPPPLSTVFDNNVYAVTNEAAHPERFTPRGYVKVDLTEPAGLMPGIAGAYYAVVRFEDANGRLSDFSPISEVLPLEPDDHAYGLMYTNVPVPPPGAGIVRRQILRSVPGSTQDFYVDIDTDDLTGTTFIGLRTDAELSAQGTTPDRTSTPGLYGDYYAFVRYINERGAYSNLSPLAGPFTVTNKDGDFVYGIAYANVPVPTQVNVVRRQILRNTGGQTDVFYVDVDTDDLTSTSFSSNRLDAELAAQEAVPLFDPEGNSLANRFGVPPTFKRVVSAHQGRCFLAADAEYAEGGCQVTNGAAAVAGVATAWTDALVGRMFYVAGAAAYYQIAAVDAQAQTITLLEPYAGATDPLASYVIRPAPAERRLVYYTEAGEPESWPPYNALQIAEDSDEITGLMTLDSFLFVMERRHVYRLTFQADPAVDGFVYPAGNRGCINDRCWTIAGGTAYALDEAGVYAFDGSEPESVSDPVRPIFSGQDATGPRINWQASALFHASGHPDEMCVRFFVALSGEYAPRHALCFDYALKRWWIEEYDRPVTASAPGLFQGRRRAYFGSSGDATYLSHEWTLDALDPTSGRTRGRVTGSDLYGLTDAAGGWPADLVGRNVAITSGRGSGQTRAVIGHTATRLALRDPWLVLPDATSVYQLAGIRWSWRSGWLHWSLDETSVPRKVEVIFKRTPAAGGNAPAALTARVYRDFMDEPVLMRVRNRPSDAEGFASEPGSPDLVALMTAPRGYAQQRMPNAKELNVEGQRYVSVGLSGVSGDCPQSVHQVAIDGAEG